MRRRTTLRTTRSTSPSCWHDDVGVVRVHGWRGAGCVESQVCLGSVCGGGGSLGDRVFSNVPFERAHLVHPYVLQLSYTPLASCRLPFSIVSLDPLNLVSCVLLLARV